jgi:hypothetical protein
MATPATLLDSAFAEAIAYWRANNGGTRAGLIANLVAVIEVTNGVAANWVDAFTAEIFNLGMSADTTYAAFKTWLLSVGAVRGEAGVRCAFDNLKEGSLINDARNQLIGKLNDGIAVIDTKITNTLTSVTEVKLQAPSVTKTTVLKALELYENRLQSQRSGLVTERDRLGVLVAG